MPSDPATWGKPVDITPEMVKAGRLAWGYANPAPPVEAIYHAMHAAAPVPLVSEAEDRIAALRAENARLHDEIKWRTDERQSVIQGASDRMAVRYREACEEVIGGSIARTWSQDNSFEDAIKAAGWEYAIWDDCYHPPWSMQANEITLLRAALAAKDARIAELDTRLAGFTNVPPVASPKPNPFREFPVLCSNEHRARPDQNASHSPPERERD